MLYRFVALPSPHQQDRRTVDPNRFRRQSSLEEGKRLRNEWEMRQFSVFGFFRNRRKGSKFKNLAGALHADRVGCKLAVAWEVKMEIPV
jgi:hypothetical protein